MTATPPSPTESPVLDEMARKAEHFANELAVDVDENLEAVFLFGSVVRGGYDAGSSDVNMGVLLNEDNANVLRTVAQCLKTRAPSPRTSLFVLTQEEIANSRDVFPIQLQDISRHHRTVLGEDHLGDLEIERKHLIIDCEDQLRTLVVDLRRHFIDGSDSKDTMRQNLVRILRGYIPPLGALVELETGKAPTDRAALFEAVPGVLETDVSPLHDLERLYRDADYKPTGTEFNDMLDGVMRLLKVTAWKADKLAE